MPACCSLLRRHLRPQVLRRLPYPLPVPVHDALLRQVLYGLCESAEPHLLCPAYPSLRNSVKEHSRRLIRLTERVRGWARRRRRGLLDPRCKHPRRQMRLRFRPCWHDSGRRAGRRDDEVTRDRGQTESRQGEATRIHISYSAPKGIGLTKRIAARVYVGSHEYTDRWPSRRSTARTLGR